MRLKIPLLFALAALYSSTALAVPGNITCYHVMEAECRSETTDEQIGFIALTVPIKGGSLLGFENCANSYDVKLDFWDYLNEDSDVVPELCRPGTVRLDKVLEHRRGESECDALDQYRKRARECMLNSRHEKCVTIEDLDLIQKIGNTRVLLKGRLPTR